MKECAEFTFVTEFSYGSEVSGLDRLTDIVYLRYMGVSGVDMDIESCTGTASCRDGLFG